MKFSDIIWDTWKIRVSVKIQQNIERTIIETGERMQLASNMPDILDALAKTQNNFPLEKQRYLIQINKFIAEADQMNLTDEEKNLINYDELIEIKKILEE